MSATESLERFAAWLIDHGVTRIEVASALGVDASTVTRKVLGERAFRLDEIRALLAYLSERVGRPVSFDELFGTGRPPMVGRGRVA